MHDTLRLEGLGVAAVPVATEVFAAAARAQAAALGRPEFDAVYVSHPVQDQTDAEIEAKADAVIEDLVSRLTGPSVQE